MEERPWHRHYDAGVPPTLDYEQLTVPELLARTVERVPERTALVFLNGRLSYRELAEHVRRMASALAGLGVEPGSRVGIQLPNLPQTVIAYHAALSLGAEVVMTNPLYTAREVEHQWGDAGCSVGFTTDYVWDQRLRGARGSLGVKHVIVASIPEYLRFPLSWLAPFKLRRSKPPAWARVAYDDHLHPFRGLLERSAPDPPRPDLDLDALAVLQYTGGTTGVSKGAMLTHRNLSVNVQQCASWFNELVYGEEVVLTALPLFHVFGMTVCMNFAALLGMTMVLVPDPRDVKHVVKSIPQHRVSFFPGVPAMYNALNNFPGIEGVDLGSVKACISGSAPIPLDVLERFEGLTGARVTEGFGLSETSPVTHVNPMRGVRKVGWIGVPVPDTDARVVDVDEGTRTLPVGEEGELVLRGPQVMRGYWNRPDETAGALRDGWFFTGDLAEMDVDGYFRIVGRKKDMINASGLKVYPDEVDQVLIAHPDVLEAATIGVPDPKRGETVKSFVVACPGRSPSVESLEAHCRENLAAYKVPREFEFLDELPKSSVLKILRRELRDREIAKREAGGK